MKDIQQIWQQLNGLTTQLESMMGGDKMDDIFLQFEREEKLRKRYNPILFGLTILMTLFFIGIVSTTTDVLTAAHIGGITCITLASICIAIFAQVVKMPLQQLDYSSPTMHFIKIVKNQLDKKRAFLLVGVVGQVLFLMLGLYLLIFATNSTNTSSSELGVFFGIMFGLTGLALGGSWAAFNQHYKSIYDKLSRFKAD